MYSVISGLFLGVDFTAWNYSIFYIGAGVAAILLNLQVIIMPTLTAIFDKYKIRPVFLVLVPIMAVGVLLTGGVCCIPGFVQRCATELGRPVLNDTATHWPPNMLIWMGLSLAGHVGADGTDVYT